MGDFTDRRGSDMTKEIELGELWPEAAVKDCWQHQKCCPTDHLAFGLLASDRENTFLLY